MDDIKVKEYLKIKEEINPVKDLLFWCGSRYLNKITTIPYPIRAIIRHRNFRIGRVSIGFMRSEEYRLPKDLQDRIITVMEDYVAEKEKQMSEI